MPAVDAQSDQSFARELLAEPVGRPAWSPTALRVLQARYLRRDPSGEPAETPDGMFTRVARHLAEAEPPAERAARAEIFFELMRQGLFLPNSPTLMNAGVPAGQLAACFVLPVADSIEEIFDAVKHMAMVQQTGGGTGFSFSALRPAGDLVASTQGSSSGPLTFMEVFNTATDTIKQGGKRRGANMGVLEIQHPDILDFIAAKADPERFTNFNLSVGLDDAFMAALAAGEAYDLINPRSGQPTARLDAGRVFALLCRCAWLSGEPGVLFLDRINADNPTPELGRLVSTNPCGELPLLPYESCNLGSLNLVRFCRDGRLDWPRLGAATRWAVRLLDDVIEGTHFPLPAIASATLQNRKIGLGVMGFADLLAALGLSYLDDDALALADELMAFVATEARRASEALAAERGPFPAQASQGGLSGAAAGVPRRNATLTTIAPTGTLSILAGCSAGIEPLFAPALRRRMLDGEIADELHPPFAQALEKAGLLTADLTARVAEAGSARVEGVPAAIARRFVSAHEVPPRRHVEIQAAFQRHVDNSVSKTVNLPAGAREPEVAELIRLAYELGCKGVTVYRDASRADQTLQAGTAVARRPQASKQANCPDCGSGLTRRGPMAYCPACAWASPLDSPEALE